MFFPLHWALLRPQLECCVQFWTPLIQEGHCGAGAGPEKGRKGLEHQEHLREEAQRGVSGFAQLPERRVELCVGQALLSGTKGQDNTALSCSRRGGGCTSEITSSQKE